MKTKILTSAVLGISFFFLSFYSEATHIVGGGFQMIANGNYNYTIQLTVYFDEINGSTGAKDSKVFFSIFRKSDNKLMVNIPGVLLDTSEKIISYKKAACGTQVDSVRTRVLNYSKDVDLPASVYNDPLGYYVVWERCCRNNGIDNIQNPGAVGQTFVMDFPPVSKNSQPYLNDSPVFKPVPNTLFCINQPSFIDFGATDFDGDSLVYEIVDPLSSTGTATGSPVTDTAVSGPYLPVLWSNGFSTAVQIPGNPELSINPKTGLMTVTPSMLGLFVFSVSCSEFRQGKKIGMVRREFQQVVISCVPNTAPVITLPDPTRNRLLGQNDTIFVANNTQTKTCINVKVSDKQPLQTLTMRALPLNFSPISPISGDTVKLIVSSTDTARLNFCLPACVGSTRANPFHLRVIAYDNGCSGSLYDTLDIFIVLTVPPSFMPSIGLSIQDDELQVYGGDSVTIKVNTVVQPTQVNQIKAEVLTNRMQQIGLSSVGMFFPAVSGIGPLSGFFRWKAPCAMPVNQPYTVNFVASTNFCGQNIVLKKPVLLKILPPKINSLIYEKGSDSSKNRIEIEGETDISYKKVLVGKSRAGSRVMLSPLTGSLELQKYGIEFAPASGITTVESEVSWNPDCSHFGLPYPADILFRSSGVTCGGVAYDTLTLKINLKPTRNIEFNPINLLTSNEDNINEKISLDVFNALPGCGVEFEGISIYDRWGKKAFYTSDPGFLWPLTRVQYGVYFYEIRFNNQQFQGWIEVMK